MTMLKSIYEYKLLSIFEIEYNYNKNYINIFIIFVTITVVYPYISYPYCFMVKTFTMNHEPIANHIPYKTFPASYITHRKTLQCGDMIRKGDTINPYHVKGAQK